MNGTCLRQWALLMLLALLLVRPTQALAHGGVPDGHKQTYTQVIGPYEVAVTLELPPMTPGVLFIDIFPMRDPGAAAITLRAAPQGQSFVAQEAAVVTFLPGPQGVYYTQLPIDQPGNWEVELMRDGVRGNGTTRIPYLGPVSS